MPAIIATCYAARMGRFGFTIHVRGSGTDSNVGVDAPLDKFGLVGMTLRSSRVRAPNIEGKRWPAALSWMIEDRLRSAGARKGRVLAVWQRDQVVAACSWHLHESGPIVIFDLGCRTDLSKEKAQRARTALLACLRDIAETLGRSRDELRWTDRPLDRMDDREQRKRAKQAVRQRAIDLTFEPLRPRPKWLRREWVLARRFS